MTTKLANMDREFVRWKTGKEIACGERFSGTVPMIADSEEFEEARSHLSNSSPPKSPEAVAQPLVTPEQARKKRTIDAAVNLLAEQVELDLAYLLELDTSAHATEPKIISVFGLPPPVDGQPAISFDPALHLRALRAPEKGLLYQNPLRDELKHNEQLPTDYSSALLVPVTEHADRGFVLAGFVTDPQRVFGAEDLAYFQAVAAQLVSQV